MDIHADAIHEAEIEELQRRVRELERQVREMERGRAGWPYTPRPCPDCPPYPWKPWSVPPPFQPSWHVPPCEWPTYSVVW